MFRLSYKYVDKFHWSTLISILGQNGKGKEALEIFYEFNQRFKPDDVAVLSVLNACRVSKLVTEALELYQTMKIFGISPNMKHHTVIMNILEESDRVDEAISLFKIIHNNTNEHQQTSTNIALSSLISTLTQQGKADTALLLFDTMEQEGSLKPDSVTLITVLQACRSINLIDRGVQILTSMNKKYGIKPQMKHCTVVVTLLIESDLLANAVKLLVSMNKERMPVSHELYRMVVIRCKNAKAVALGKQLHSMIICNDILIQDNILTASLISLLCQEENSLQDASALFDLLLTRGITIDVSTYNAMINGLEQYGKEEQVLKLFDQMQKRGFKPDGITILCVLNVYRHAKRIKEASQLFKTMRQKFGIELNISHCSVVVTMFAELGYLEQSFRTLVYMEEKGLTPPLELYTMLVTVCADHSALGLGQKLHNRIVDNNIQQTAMLKTSFINMYAKYGQFEEALKILRSMSTETTDVNIVTWNSVIAGLCFLGNGPEALDLFDEMILNGIQPNEITIVSLLTACSHSHLLEQGRQIFHSFS